jgi:hypothetical protein
MSDPPRKAPYELEKSSAQKKVNAEPRDIFPKMRHRAVGMYGTAVKFWPLTGIRRANIRP